jgi:hypothetical protein
MTVAEGRSQLVAVFARTRVERTPALANTAASNAVGLAKRPLSLGFHLRGRKSGNAFAAEKIEKPSLLTLHFHPAPFKIISQIGFSQWKVSWRTSEKPRLQSGRSLRATGSHDLWLVGDSSISLAASVSGRVE